MQHKETAQGNRKQHKETAQANTKPYLPHSFVQFPRPIGGSDDHHALATPIHAVKLDQKLGLEAAGGVVLCLTALRKDRINFI